MNDSVDRPSLWTRAMRQLDLLTAALDNDIHDYTALRLDAIEKRLDAVEEGLRNMHRVGGDSR